MSMTTRATQKRTPPSALRSQKDIARQSPGSRLRSRSTSHDNELYRMGLRKNAEGEWAAVDNLPTAGIAQVMRQIAAVKRELDERFKREESERERGMREDTAASSMSIDMGDSTVVLEEIRVYMERSRETSAMDLDEADEDLVQSIEVKVEVEEEVFSNDAYENGANHDGQRQSLADIPEDGEDGMALDEGSGQDEGATLEREFCDITIMLRFLLWKSSHSHQSIASTLS